MAGPGDDRVAPAAGVGRLRASHADREQVVDAVKAAFIQGRLSKGELDERVGQALAARTHAELAALTADIPAGQDLARPPEAGRAQLRNTAASRAVKSGVWAITAIILTVSVLGTAAGQPGAAVILAVFIVLLTSAATVVVSSVIGGVLMLESRRRKRSRGLPAA
jgi:hypothetical protein